MKSRPFKYGDWGTTWKYSSSITVYANKKPLRGDHCEVEGNDLGFLLDDLAHRLGRKIQGNSEVHLRQELPLDRHGECYQTMPGVGTQYFRLTKGEIEHVGQTLQSLLAQKVQADGSHEIIIST